MARMLTRNPRLHLQLLVESRTRPRWASSDSSPDPPKPEKKLSDRLSAVIDAVNDRKLPPELRGRSNAVRSETDIMNVVEQRIWHSMEEGQFENLPGKGKPLDLKTNPHADPAEDTLYRILMRNGCAPEWVELNKEIRYKINEWRLSLKKAWAKRLDGHDAKWVEESEALKAQLRAINDKRHPYQDTMTHQLHLEEKEPPRLDEEDRLLSLLVDRIR
ncbi:hypothetical protein AAC387_Pa11g0428 [Persea americana]